MLPEKTADINNTLQCKNCSAPVTFQPGSKGLACGYCGTYNPIEYTVEAQQDAIQEYEFAKYRDIDDSDKLTIQVLKCNSCGASASYSNTTTASSCAFCTAPLVVTGGTMASIIKPKAMIPFAVTQQRALEDFKKYAKKQFLAPNDFRSMTQSADRLHGMYIPYWTYDALVKTDYTGERGDDYQVPETYTTTENGISVTRTRMVTHTRWSNASGRVSNSFDDLTVIASKSLPAKCANDLDPWNYKDLVPYNDAYIAGFAAEMYNIDIKKGFDNAFELMQPRIESTICNDIGGDHQRVDNRSSKFYNVRFKHVLLPIWISSYKYKDKTYHFLVNGQTGEVQGEQPISAAKVFGIVLAIAALIWLIYMLAESGK